MLDPESIGEEGLSSVYDTEFGFPLMGGNDGRRVTLIPWGKGCLPCDTRSLASRSWAGMTLECLIRNP